MALRTELRQVQEPFRAAVRPVREPVPLRVLRPPVGVAVQRPEELLEVAAALLPPGVQREVAEPLEVLAAGAEVQPLRAVEVAEVQRRTGAAEPLPVAWPSTVVDPPVSSRAGSLRPRRRAG